MSVFLVVIDRSAAKGKLDPQKIAGTQAMLKQTADAYVQYLGPDYVPTPKIEVPTHRKDVHVLHWQRQQSEVAYSSKENLWAISGGHNVASRLVGSVRPVGGVLTYVRPVWGQYAAIVGTQNRSQIFAWNTTPALEAIHWGATADYIVISNRQILVGLNLAATKAALRPELSMEFLEEYLLYGYSLTGQTPFKGVQTLSVNSSLKVVEGEVELTQMPPGLASDLEVEHSVEEGAEALAAALKGAMGRTEEQLEGRPLQLRLSGGKDSRVLLALLRDRPIDFRIVTFGVPANPDVKLAAYLAELVGIQGEVRAPRPADGASVASRLKTTIRESGGIPPSEAHTAQYRGADPERPREAIMLGQWPLYKGGLARRMRSSSEEITRTLLRQGGTLVRQKVRTKFDEKLLEWARGPALNHELEKLYIFAREFRSGRYLQAHVEQFSGHAMLAYPVADAEVAAVCDSLTMYEKVSEKALFGALRELWPEVMRVPLDRSKWLFEAPGPDPEFSGPWYAERYSGIPYAQPRKFTAVEPVVSEYSEEAVQEMSTYLTKSDNYKFLQELISDEMRTAIGMAAEGEYHAPPSMSDRIFIKYVWRICAADVWLSGDWMMT